MKLNFNEVVSGKSIPVQAHAKIRVQAAPGEKYHLIDDATGKNPADLQVTREGNTLYLRSESFDVEVVVEEFWEACQPGSTQCYAIIDTPEYVGGELVGETIVTQEGAHLGTLLAGEIGTLAESATVGLLTTAAIAPSALGFVGVSALAAGVVGVVASGGGSSNQEEAPQDTTAPDMPSIGITGDGKTVSGKAEPNSRISIKNAAGDEIGTATADKDGNYTVDLTTHLTNGEEITADATDAAGNTSPKATTTATDTTPPKLSEANISDDGTTVSGKAEPNSTVTIKDEKGNIIGTGEADENGDYTVTLSNPQQNGQEVTATATDKAGNTSEPTSDTAPDITPPKAPSVAISQDGTKASGVAEPNSTVTIKDKDGNVIGTATANADGKYEIPLTDALTNGEKITATATDKAGNESPEGSATATDSTPPEYLTAKVNPTDGKTVTGETEPNSTVTIKDEKGNIIGTGKADEKGYYTVTLSNPQQNGQEITATATDEAGNTSKKPVSATAPDITAPDAPTGTVSDDGTTVSGKAEPNSTVKIYDKNGALIGEGTADNNGSYGPITLKTPQKDGDDITATATDAKDNTSLPATVHTPDKTPPNAPEANINDDGTTVSGKAEPNSTVTIKDATGNVLGTAKADANGDYSVKLSTPQTNGQALKATATDAAGNLSDPADVNAPDKTAPDIPKVAISQDGTKATGSAEPNSTVTLKDKDGNVIGTATAGVDGKYEIPLTDALTNGEKITATATDKAGNESPEGSATAQDTTKPDAPSIEKVSADGLTVTGKAEPNSTVTIKDATGNVLGTAKADADGNYNVPLKTAQKNGQEIKATATDAANNESDPTIGKAQDKTAPDAPSVAISQDGTKATGSAEPNSTVTLKDEAGKVIGTATADKDGNYEIPLTDALTNGEKITATATDAAKNESPEGHATATDSTPPKAPEAFISDDGKTVKGTAEPNSTVTIKDKDGNPLGTATAGVDGKYEVTLTTPQTDGQDLKATATDATGNTSPETDVKAPDNTPPADPTVSGSLLDNVDVVGGTPLPAGQEQPITADSNNNTNDNTPSLVIPKAVADAATADGNTPKLVVDDKVVDAVVSQDADGNTVLTPKEPLAEGKHTVSYLLQDTAGNQSGTAPATTFTVDTTAPDKPAKPENYQDNVGDVQSNTSTAPTTDDTTPGINIGKVPEGETPTLYVDGEKVEAEETKDADGNTTLTPKTPLGEGAHNLTYTLTDTAGNESEKSDPIAITVDTTKPATPTTAPTVTDNVANDGSGDELTPAETIANNGVTNDNTPTVVVPADAVKEGETPQLVVDGKVVEADVVKNDDGSYKLTPKEALTDAEHKLSYNLKDAAGNVSDNAPETTVTVDTTPPTTPTTAATVTDNVANDGSGDELTSPETIADNGVTNDNTPSVVVPADAVKEGETPQLVVDGKVVEADVVKNDDGSYKLTPKEALTDAEHKLSYNLKDAAGNVSDNAPETTVTVDTTPPTTPTTAATVTDNVANDGSGDELTSPETIADNGVTNDNTPSVVVPADAVKEGETPQLVVDGKVVEADVVKNDDGSYKLTPKEALTDAEHKLSYNLKDAAGNVSDNAPETTVTVDTVAPEPATVALKNDTGTNNNDGITNDGELNITLAADSTIKSVIATKADGTEVVISVTDGKYTLPEGEYSKVVVTTQDAAGNEATQATGAITVDKTNPEPATVALKNDTGTENNDGITNDGELNITPVANSTIKSVIATKKDGGTVEIPVENGKYTLPEGEYSKVVVTTQDAAGNEATQETGAITVDKTNPEPATVALKNDTGTNNNDGITNDGELNITPAADSTIKSVIATKKDGTTTVEIPVTDGKYTLPEGEYSKVVVTTQDAAGNEATKETGAITVDTTAPTGVVTKAEISLDGNNDGYINKTEKGSATTTDVKVSIDNSKVVAGDVVTLDVGGTVTKHTVDGEDIDNKYVTFTDINLPNEGETLTVKAGLTDAAGNASPTTVSDSAVLDTTIASKLTISFPKDTLATTGVLTSSATSGDELAYDATTVDVQVAFNKDHVKVGDTITVSDNATTTNTRELIVSQTDIDKGYVATTLPKPAEDSTLKVSASIKDTAGNTYEETTASSVTINLLPPGTPTVEIMADGNNNGYINASEKGAATTTGIKVTLPPAPSNGENYQQAEVGNTVAIYQADGTTQIGTTHTLIQADIDAGFYIFENITLPDNGETFTVKAQLADANGTADKGWLANAPANDTAIIDTTLPTVAITSEATSTLKAGEKTTVTFTLSEASNNFTASDVSVTGGTLSDFQKVSDTVYTATFTPAENTDAGSATVSVATNKFSDVAGNENTTSASTTINYDTKAPTATIALNDTALKIGDNPTVTITFSEAVTGFTVDDLIAENGTLSNLQQNGSNPTVYTATFTPTANIEDTSNTISLAKDSYTDTAGNNGSAAHSGNYTIDTKLPTGVVSSVDIVLDNKNAKGEAVNGGDGYINAIEKGTATNTDVKVGLNSDVAVDDVVGLDTNGDGTYDKTITVTQTDIDAQSVTFTGVNLPTTDGEKLTVKAAVTGDKAGNTVLNPTALSDSAILDTTAPTGKVSKVEIMLDTKDSTGADKEGGDGYINATEKGTASTTGVQVSLSDEVQVGDIIRLDIDADGNGEYESTSHYTVTQADIDAGRKTTFADVATLTEGNTIKVKAAIIGDIAGNSVDTPTEITDEAKVDTVAPEVADTTIHYFENSLLTDVLGTITATETTTPPVSYQFTNGTTTSADGRYTIDATSGEIKLTATGGGLANTDTPSSIDSNDFETGNNTFTQEIQVKDVAGNTSNATVTLKVNNVIGLPKLKGLTLSTSSAVKDDGVSVGSDSDNIVAADSQNKIMVGWTEAGKVNSADPDIYGDGNPANGIYTGQYDDYVKVYGSIGNNYNDSAVTVDLGAGNDILEVGSQIKKQSKVNMGDGNDVILISESVNNNQGWKVLIAEQAQVNMGKGRDKLTIEGKDGFIQDDGTVVDMGSQEDIATDVNIVNVAGINNNSKVLFGAGSDELTIRTFFGFNIGSKQPEVQMGAGDDKVIYGGVNGSAVSYELKGTIDGGAGIDTLVLTTDSDSARGGSHVTVMSSSNFKGFEHIELQGKAIIDIKYSDLLNSGNETPLYIKGSSETGVDLGNNNWNSDFSLVTEGQTNKINLSDGNSSWVKGTEQVTEGGVTYDVYHYEGADTSTAHDVYIQTGIVVF